VGFLDVVVGFLDGGGACKRVVGRANGPELAVVVVALTEVISNQIK
jgi:hypothetical protein